MMRPLLPGLLCAALAACAAHVDERNTLGSLEGRQLSVEPDAHIDGSRRKAIQAYRDYLNVAPRDSLRPEAMRRLGDMEIESADSSGSVRLTQDGYRQAIGVYQNLLRSYPNNPGNDRVLYQLARAYDQLGDSGRALTTLGQLVTAYPGSRYINEAEFRRGELLFVARDYGAAEQAYARIVRQGEASPFYERSLYMRGWSLFKQGRYEDGLNSFFIVLDRKLIGRDHGEPLDKMAALTRADRELVEDTFRVVSISLASLQGANSIPAFFPGSGRHDYEFRVYQQLGDLYFKQERVKDAADTYNAFARRYPTHTQAPVLQQRVIEAYQQAGFTELALETKKEYVQRYGVKSDYRVANTADAYARVEPFVRQHLEDLARYYHAAGQKSHAPPDYAEAGRWYRQFLESFPADAKAPALNYHYADLLFEQKRYGDAAEQYLYTAYHYPPHAKSADAGFAALQALSLQEKAVQGDEQLHARKRAIDAALRFADTFPADARRAKVLTNTAEQLYAQHDTARAIVVTQNLLGMKPPAAPELRRTAWTVLAHSEFERGSYDRAEAAYKEALALTDDKAPNRPALVERLAASVYKQGEQARAGGRQREAAGLFLRVAQVAPASTIRATADFDAAASLIAVKDWTGAAHILEAFRRNYPKHPLQAEVPTKLAVCYLESGQAARAAAEFEAIAGSGKDVRVSREALWQAAELYQKAGQTRNALVAYERYVRQNPSPLEPAIEARARLADLCHKEGQEAKRMAWTRELVEAERQGGRERSDRTRALGAEGALVLAEPVYAAYRQVKLVEPLKKNLKIKKERMQKALDAYALASEYGVAEVATAAVYRTGEIYQDFSKAMLQSQRPRGLNADELEQYNVLLEEQAFPFEEKAIAIYEINAQRTRQDIYDQWVKRSFAALAKLRPVRYAKSEKGEGVIRAIR